jgi:hypothetical protein
MADKGRDVSRGRRLKAEEAAHYAKIPQQVMEEIPPATSNVVRQVIAKLRQAREEKGLSLADMEGRAGMTRANLAGSRMKDETCSFAPSSDMLGRWGAGLRYTSCRSRRRRSSPRADMPRH